MENYDATAATRQIDAFVEGLSNWYVRRSRRRFWRGTEADDGTKQSAYYTLYVALTTLSRLCAPFIPFMSEKLITKSFERILEKGKNRGFITYEELGKSLGKRGGSYENTERAFLIIADNKITLVEKKIRLSVK